MRKLAPCVAVLGTGSDVGKSIVASALCRIFSDMGLGVVPFKAQNMSNNSYVTSGGGEMGRAQVVQAECARVEPRVEMNPLLLKPSGNCHSQIVLNGYAVGEVSSAEFRSDRSNLFEEVLKSLTKLREHFELVVIEGAGSCAEVNLSDYDIANFRTALSCNAPVIIVADIDRGGVFAQVIGTLDLIKQEERKLVKGIIINKFRGDASLFEDGVKIIQERTGIPLLGVIPYFQHIEIDSEDSLSLDTLVDPPKPTSGGKINIAVIRFPHISNFTDFTPLLCEPSVNLSYLSRPVSLEGMHLLILPGSKNVRSDLDWLRKTGWAAHIQKFAENEGRVCGICGGYQMLGKEIIDTHGVEGRPGKTQGLNLLDIHTVMEKKKKLAQVKANWMENGESLTGYEIHMGRTFLGPDARPVIELLERGGSLRADGAINGDKKVWGTYLHGLFDETAFRASFLSSISKYFEIPVVGNISPAAFRQRQYDLLAEHFRKHLDVGLLMEIVGKKEITALEGVKK